MNVAEDRLSKLADISLDAGSHGGNFAKGHCALEVVSWLAGAPDDRVTDAPPCVCPILRTQVIEWNDRLPDNAARDRWIKPLLVHLLDTRIADDAVLLRRMYMVQDWHIRVRAPIFLRLAKLDAHADALVALPPIVDEATLRGATETCRAARAAAGDAAGDAAGAAARAAARAAAGVAARAAARAAAGDAAGAAAWVAAKKALDPAVEECLVTYQALLLAMCQVRSEAKAGAS